MSRLDLNKTIQNVIVDMSEGIDAIDAIDGRLSLDVDDLTKQVQELLPNFKVN